MKIKRNLIIAVSLLILIFVAFSIYWVRFLARAHSSFENYYAFRGCAELLEKTDDYGVCRTSSGQTIKIVKFQGQWFLDGDLPCGFLCF